MAAIRLAANLSLWSGDPRGASANFQSDRFLNDNTRELFVRVDWTRTALGSIDQWPQSLRTIVDTVLSNRNPMVVLWGAELVQIYNDGYAALLGHRHPDAMGQRARECWPESWHTSQPVYDAVLREGRESYVEDVLFMVERYGHSEEAYFSLSYGPLRDDDAVVHGVLVAVVETTRKVLDQRRLRSLRQLATVTGKARTVAEVGSGAIDVLRKSEDDISFALLYGAAPDVQTVDRSWAPVLLARTGIEATADTLFLNRWRDAGAGTSSFVDVSDPEGTAYVATLHTLGRTEPLGMVILGCNPRATLDAHLREYLELIGGSLATALENAEAFHREIRIADTLQRAALPLELRAIAGLRVDAVYAAGSDEARIGGDWYDVFALADGRIVVTIGDVCGNGVAAAAVMGGMRQMIRALAQITTNPSDILDAIDGAFRLDERSLFVTALVVVIDLESSTLTYASAGHMPPLLRHVDGRLETLHHPDLPIGLRGVPSNSSACIEFPIGASLVLYTDGLTEELRDWELGESLLRDAVTAELFAEAAHPATYVRDAVLHGRATDDMAILVVARQGAASA